MNENLITAFDACVTALEDGATLEDCLGKYPELASDLRPMLDITVQTMSVMQSIQVPIQSQQASRRRFLARAASLTSKPVGAQNPARGGSRLPSKSNGVPAPARRRSFVQSLFQTASNRAWMAVAVLIVLIVLAGTSVVRASAHSLPGTPLYALKRTIEQTQILLSPDTASRARLEEKFTEQRAQETRQVVAQGWQVPVEFGGLLNAMNGQNWDVAGVNVSVPTGTQVEGSPQIGLYTLVQGDSQSNGSVLAHQIRVEGERFDGLVENIQKSEWQVGGRVVLIGDDTHIDDRPTVGDLVEVNVMNLPGGSILAERILLLQREAGSDNLEGPSNPSATPSEDHGNGQKTGEPGPTDSLESESASQTPGSPNNGGDKTSQPTQTPEPTRTSNPTQTPNPGGSNGSNSPTSTPSIDQEVRLDGIVQSISSNAWIVEGQTILVDENTLIENNPQPGDLVEVRAVLQSNGTLLALRIKPKN